jgi:hypothetical protein
MKSKVRIAVVTAMLGVTTTTAIAQTPTSAHPFLDRFRQLQSLVTGTAGVKPPPVFRDNADAPIGHGSFAERFAVMQRDSAGSSAFEDHRTPIAVAPGAPNRNESFAERFREMQAASSDSGQFGFQPGTDELASEANSTLVAARPPRGVKPRDARPTS